MLPNPAILEPMIEMLLGSGAALNPLQFLIGEIRGTEIQPAFDEMQSIPGGHIASFHVASTNDITPPLARELLNNVIIAVRETRGEQATLLDVHRFLTEKDFRDPIIDALGNHLLKRYLQDAFTPGIAPND